MVALQTAKNFGINKYTKHILTYLIPIKLICFKIFYIYHETLRIQGLFNKLYLLTTHLKIPNRFSSNVAYLLLAKLIPVITAIIGTQPDLRSCVISNVPPNHQPWYGPSGPRTRVLIAVVEAGERFNGGHQLQSALQLAGPIWAVMKRLNRPRTRKDTNDTVRFRYFSSDYLYIGIDSPIL